MAKTVKLTKDTYLDSTSAKDDNVLVSQKLDHDLIYLGVNSYSFNFITTDKWENAPLDKLLSSIGTRLIKDGVGVRIGPNVKRVWVYGLLTYYQCPADSYFFMSIAINGVNKVKTIEQTNQWGNASIGALLSVQEGDIITLKIYKSYDVEFCFQEYVNFTDAPCNYLLVEVVE